MKKLVALLLLLATCFTLAGCKKDFYKPVESTAEEAKTVMTLKFGNKTYDVRYELYRALFLTYRSMIDGGDASVWSGENKDKYIKEIQALIVERAVDIYSTFAIAESLGINPYSTEVGKKVNDYINLSVDGGDIDGVTYPGYKDYDDYLAALREMYLNYSVQELLFRYAIVSSMVDEYYMGTLSEDQIASGVSGTPDGKLDYTREDVLAFYESDACVRVLRTFVSDDMDSEPLARAERVRAAIAEKAARGEDAVRNEMIAQGSTTAVPELEGGYVIGEYNLSKSYYAEMTSAAFALDIGEVSELVSVHDGNRQYYYILYRAEKSDAHFEENYASIAYIYLRNEIGKTYAECAAEMIESVSYSSFLSTLDHSTISMG